MKIGWNIKTALLAAIALAALALLPVLNADFTNWDDDIYITANPAVKNFTPGGMLHIFTSLHKGLYKPLVLAGFALECRLGGLNHPGIFHFDNLLLHLITCALAGWLAWQLSGKRTAAGFFVALLFGVHPMHVESVAWISERKDLLYSLFFFASICFYTGWREKGGRARYLLSIACLLLSLVSKPQGFLLPLALLLIDWLRCRRYSPQVITEKLPHTALALFFLAFALITMNQQAVFFTHPNYNRFDALCVAGYGLFTYIWRFFLPLGLSAVYPYPDKTGLFLPAAFLLASAAALALTALALRLWRNSRETVFGILFFLLTLLPGLQFMPVAPSVAFDHYSYVPYFGLLFALGVRFADIARGPHARRAWGALGAVALLLGAASFSRARVWHNSEMLWSDAIKKQPTSIVAYCNRAETRLKLNDATSALGDINAALALAPEDARSYMISAVVFQKLGDINAALSDASRAIRLNPLLAEAYLHRGNLYRELKMQDLAIKDFTQAIALDPNMAGAYNNLAGALYGKGLWQQALGAYTAALEADPYFSAAWYNRGSICLAGGNLECAESDFSRAIALDGTSWDAFAKRGTALARAGRAREALEDFNRALALNPKSGEARRNRAFLLLGSGNYAGAAADFDAALAADGPSPQALAGRGGARLAMGDSARALEDFNAALKLDPKSAQVLNNRGLAFAAIGDTARALADYNGALALEPGYAMALANRAAARLKSSGCKAALPDARLALSKSPGLAQADMVVKQCSKK